jgi:hypothetical protein
MSWFIAAITGPFLVAAFVARIFWVAVLAGWMAGDHFMDTHFGWHK